MKTMPRSIGLVLLAFASFSLAACAVPATPASEALKTGGSASVSGGGPDDDGATGPSRPVRSVAYEERASSPPEREMTARDVVRTFPDRHVREVRECWKCAR